jgi:hypothetical protein
VRSGLVPLQPIGKPYGQVGAFADLPCGVVGLMCQTHFFERLEEPVQILRQELAAKGRVDPCPNKLILGNWVVHRALLAEFSWKSYLQVLVARLPLVVKLDRTASEGVFRPDLWVGDQRT